MGFTEHERIAFYNAINHLDPDGEFVIAEKEKDLLSYVKDKIKSGEKISGKPKDEELTRALIILHLIKTYNFKNSQIEIENSFRIGGRRRESARAVETDICIKNDNEEIEILCEVKRIQDYSGTNDPSIESQLFHPHEEIVKYNKAKYLFHLSVDIPLNKEHFPLNCIGIDTSITNTYQKWEKQGKAPHLFDIVKSGEKPEIKDVFIKIGEEVLQLDKRFKDLDDHFGVGRIKRIWKLLWDAIWGGTLEDNKKFENFNKVLLAKIYDERKTKMGAPYTFQRKFKGGEPQSELDLANDINLLYKRAYREYLSKDKNIELISIKGIDFKEFPIDIVAKCVELLQSLSFHQNRYKNVDVLGEFYEMVIRDAFKQTKGLFLTHPNIVLFILSVLDIDDLVIQKLKFPTEDNRYRLPFIIDPSCGTGTFLIHYMQYVQKFIEENHKSIIEGDGDVNDFIDRHMLEKYAYKWVIDYVYGIDIEPILATACQINLILHGDGSTNIFNTDGLGSFLDYKSLNIVGSANILSTNIEKKTKYYSKDSIGKFDVIISNPPFNVSLDKTKLEDNFEITGKSEAYFLERWYQLLKPNGRIGVVLPESFFAVQDDMVGRLFLYKHFNLKAIVSLPNHAFEPHTTTSTSLLFASKKTKEEEKTFNNDWESMSRIFDSKMNSILATIPTRRNEVNFIKGIKAKDNIQSIVKGVEDACNSEFGSGFIILPFFSDEFLFNEDNYLKIKKELWSTIFVNKDRWVLFNITTTETSKFYNFSVDEIGYKAGKKGSKERPNELISIYDKEKKKIYDIKYSHSWDNINKNDKDTVLGIIKELEIWQ